MRAYPLTVELFEAPRLPQRIEDADLSGEDLLSILSMFDLYGLWRLDLETGQVFWTRDVFEIHGLEYSSGPVNFIDAIRAYHPEDRKTVAALIDEAIRKKSGFRFVLRLEVLKHRYSLIKLNCKYRVRDDNREELIGVFSRVEPPFRSVATLN